MTKLHETIIEVPDICKATFLDRKAVWILMTFLLSYAGVCIGWALTTSNDIVKIRSDVNYQAVQIDQLHKQINSKLDILIEQTQKGE